MKINCHIKPGSKHDESVELDGDVYIVRVKAPAVEGKANEATRRVLAKYFGVPPSRVSLVRGHTSSYKVFEVEQ